MAVKPRSDHKGAGSGNGTSEGNNRRQEAGNRAQNGPEGSESHGRPEEVRLPQEGLGRLNLRNAEQTNPATPGLFFQVAMSGEKLP